MPEERPKDSSVLEELLSRSRKIVSELAVQFVKRPLDDLLRWALGRVVAYLVVAALFVTGAVFLLVAGVEGLKKMEVPAWAAYLGLGVVGLGAGLIVLCCSKPREKP